MILEPTRFRSRGSKRVEKVSARRFFLKVILFLIIFMKLLCGELSTIAECCIT